MNTPEYQFLTPAVKDFPDEPIKKPKGSNKKIEHKISEEEEEYEEENELELLYCNRYNINIK